MDYQTSGCWLYEKFLFDLLKNAFIKGPKTGSLGRWGLKGIAKVLRLSVEGFTTGFDVYGVIRALQP